MILFFDTETTGLVNFKLPFSSPEQPRLVQLGLMLTDDKGEEVQKVSVIVRPEEFEIPPGLPHGITTERAKQVGLGLNHVLELFNDFLNTNPDLIVCHNYKFDSMLMESEMYRKLDCCISRFAVHKHYCTMESGTNICCIPHPSWKGKFKWPKLEELYNFLFGEVLTGAHDALVDVIATKRCYFAIREMKG